METALTGAAFGAALTAAGVYQPAVIVSQLRLENWHMIQAFLTAAAGSAIVVTAANVLGYVRLPPRSFSSLNLFARFDGNVIGGILLGTGMTLSGACPGTVLAQVALGIESGYYALAGAVVGGIVWTGLVLQPNLLPTPSSSLSKPQTRLSMYEQLGVSRGTMLVAFEAICASVVAATIYLTPPSTAKGGVHPVIGGLLIAGAQLLSILMRKSLMGTSTSYEEFGDWFWGLFSRGKMIGLPQRYNNMVFCSSMVGGAWLLSRFAPSLVAEIAPLRIEPLAAGVGGCLMIIGSRLAGGCTSGHGISGISLLSTSSVLTIGVAFAWGAVVGLLMG
ncbi:hypothetical protein QBC46DRAFT_387065 [Diplogelasinospora grovesii]|uniref:Sulphur transport domain-containing protein n=1 Tax=Diplogelasinospora grovesii TaxID=303347 RepID=A0AAN6N611_9PEZI|nr:hypothetical protein QBC46DRAFT_387065 [Diplogelasinospora grovesii]